MLERKVFPGDNERLQQRSKPPNNRAWLLGARHRQEKTMSLESTVRGPDRSQTFPRQLFHHARVRGTAPAIREKDLGIWQTWTWAEVAERVRALACGLAALGFRRGDNLAIIGDNRPHLYMMMSAAQCLGGVPVPLYQDAVAAEMLFVLQDAATRFAAVEDQEQVDKLLEIKDQAPQFEHIVYDDPRGMRHYNQPFIHDIHALMELGRIHDRNHPDFLDAEVAQGQGNDMSVMLYTSGTTGQPKGVCQTHGAFIAAARGSMETDRLDACGDILSYLPMAWVGDHLFSFAQALVVGFTINCPESTDTVTTDLREIGPTYYFAPPRVFESLLTSIMIRMEDAGASSASCSIIFWGGQTLRGGFARRQAGGIWATACSTDWAIC
jgi:long-chain acyl-CoA synthetase